MDDELLDREMPENKDISRAARPPIRVLFVCTGNSARSIMAEALLRRKGGADFQVASAGTKPRGVNPLTLRVLDEAGVDASGARSKSVTEFLHQPWDYVITVCDRARQTCPVFPGSHESLHWGYDDPDEAEGSAAERLDAFRRVMTLINERIGVFVPIALRDRRRAGGSRRRAGMKDGSAGPSQVELHLLRHADAGDPDAWQGSDDERPLSDTGRRQSERLAHFLADAGFRPDIIVSSPKLRALETARIVGERLQVKVMLDARLGDDASLSAVEGVLTSAGDVRRPVLVGHDPDFSALVSVLCGASGVPLRKAALARIDAERPLAAGGGLLRWLVPPDLLGNER